VPGGGHALHAGNVAQPRSDFADTSAAGHPTDDQLDVVPVLAHLVRSGDARVLGELIDVAVEAL
jgi:hypothetical protein